MNPGPGFIEVLAFYTNLAGHPCQNACGYAVDGVVDQVTADAVSDWLAPAYKAQITAGSFWRGVRIIVGNDGPPGEFNSASSAGAGTPTGDTEQLQVQGLIHKATGLAGRKFRGRMYLPDILDSQCDSQGNLNASAIAKLQGIADAWFGLHGAEDLIGDPYLLHADGLTAPTLITAMSVEGKVATQRRRFRR